MLCTSFLTLFTAVVADWGPDWLIALRILEGLGEGVTYPAAASFWARWAPAHERSRMIGFCFAGAQMGTVLAIPLTGLLIEIRNDCFLYLKKFLNYFLRKNFQNSKSFEVAGHQYFTGSVALDVFGACYFSPMHEIHHGSFSYY